jgi:hypothetical protein
MSALAPVHFSRLRNMAKSPAHYLSALTIERADTPAMRLGRLVHMLLLEEEAPVAIFDGRKIGKEWDAFEKAHAGREIVAPSEMLLAENIAAAVMANETARDLLTGACEQHISWSFAGRECAGRLDVWTPERVVELKTTGDAEPGRFVRTALRMAYHAQLAWYQDGLSAAGLGGPEQAFIVSVESKAPHVVTCLELTARALDFGRRLYVLWFEQLRNCERSGIWPGYASGIVPFDAPDDLNLVIDGEEVAA